MPAGSRPHHPRRDRKVTHTEAWGGGGQILMPSIKVSRSYVGGAEAPRLSGDQRTFSSSLDAVCLGVDGAICQPLLCLLVRSPRPLFRGCLLPFRSHQHTRLMVGHPHGPACAEPRSNRGGGGVGGAGGWGGLSRSG